MCGRTRCTLRVDDFPRACHVSGRRVRQVDMNRYRPSFNVSPGFNVPVVRRADGPDDDGVVVHCMKWGLIPSFTKPNEKPDHYKMFNARSESIKERASFRRLLPKNRCLVAVEGFYEWKKTGSKRQPYYIHFKDGRPLVFAALYDSWKNGEGEILHAFTIVTTSSSSSLGWLHDRMPVIFGNKESSDSWLNGSLSFDLDALLKPYEDVDLVWHPVTPAMGKSSFDGPECIVEIQLKAEEAKSITQFFSKKGDEGRQEPPLREIAHEEPPKKPKMMTKDGDDASETDVSKTPTSAMCGKESIVIKAKRGHEEELVDDDKTRPTVRSPLKKKATSSSGKQPTLFSFFGKS